MVFHLEKVIKSKEFYINDLCNYGYWRCFDKIGHNQNFLNMVKFVDKNLNEYPQDQIVKLSNKKNKKINLGILSADLKRWTFYNFFFKNYFENYNKDEIEIYLFSNQIKDEYYII